MRIVFSWDDGALEDQRLFEMHEKYEIPGMFFVPTRNREGRKVLSSKMISGAESKYVKFGGHTDNHVYLTDIPLSAVEKEIVDNKKYLEDILGHKIKHFCLPGGRYDPEILKIVYRHYKTIRTADTMNFFNKSSRLIKPAFHMFNRGKKSLIGNALRNKSYKAALKVVIHPFLTEFDIYKLIIGQKSKSDDKTDIFIWGHSWELEEYGLWKKVENLMEFISKGYKDRLVDYDSL